MTSNEKPTGAPTVAEEGSCLSFWQKFTYALGQLSVSLSPALIGTWLVYFYTGRMKSDDTPLMLVSAIAMSLGGFIPRFLEAFAEPIVGHLSDKWRTRWGRRMPWITFGTPILAFFSITIFFPPNPSGMGGAFFTVGGFEITANFIWLLFTHTGFWFMYTAVVIPYLALLPEITPYLNERIRVSEYMAYSDVIGSVLGSLGLSVMIGIFSTGLVIGPLHMRNAYEVSGIIIGAIFTVSFYLSIWKVRERPAEEVKDVEFHIFLSMKETFKNFSFIPYVIASAAIRMGTDIVLASMPFFVAILMGLGEALAGGLQGVILIGAAILFPFVSKMAEKRGKKRVFALGMAWFTVSLLLFAVSKHFPIFGWPIGFIAGLIGFPMSSAYVSFTHSIVTLALCAFPVSIIFVLQRPILSDVIDEDERLTGFRREAMYNGMEGLIAKPASAVAYAIVPLLNGYLGSTPEHPWGIIASPIIASVIMFIGYLGFLKYPFKK